MNEIENFDWVLNIFIHVYMYMYICVYIHTSYIFEYNL
jgi:hypothetical protein